MKKSTEPRVLGLVALVICGLGAGAVYWQFSRTQSLESQVAVLETETPDEAELMAQLKDTEVQLASFQEKLSNLEEGVPDVAYIPTLLKDLETVGKDHDIRVTGVRPAPSSFLKEDELATSSAYSEIDIEVTGTGRYRQILEFVEALEDFPKVIAVRQVNLAPKRDSLNEDPKALEAKVTLTAFVYPFEVQSSKARPSNEGLTDDLSVTPTTGENVS